MNAAIPDDLDVNRALLSFKLKDYRDALRRADLILEFGPQIALSWRFKGECLFAMERYAEALQCFSSAEKLGGPGSEDLFIWRALSLYNGGDKEEGMQVVRDYLAAGKGEPEEIERARQALKRLEREAKPLWKFW